MSDALARQTDPWDSCCIFLLTHSSDPHQFTLSPSFSGPRSTPPRPSLSTTSRSSLSESSLPSDRPHQPATTASFPASVSLPGSITYGIQSRRHHGPPLPPRPPHHDRRVRVLRGPRPALRCQDLRLCYGRALRRCPDRIRCLDRHAPPPSPAARSSSAHRLPCEYRSSSSTRAFLSRPLCDGSLPACCEESEHSTDTQPAQMAYQPPAPPPNTIPPGSTRV